MRAAHASVAEWNNSLRRATPPLPSPAAAEAGARPTISVLVLLEETLAALDARIAELDAMVAASPSISPGSCSLAPSSASAPTAALSAAANRTRTSKPGRASARGSLREQCLKACRSCGRVLGLAFRESLAAADTASASVLYGALRVLERQIWLLEPQLFR